MTIINNTIKIIYNIKLAAKTKSEERILTPKVAAPALELDDSVPEVEFSFVVDCETDFEAEAEAEADSESDSVLVELETAEVKVTASVKLADIVVVVDV